MPIDALLPPRSVVDADALSALSDQELLQVSLELYREAALVIRACGRNHEPALLAD